MPRRDQDELLRALERRLRLGPASASDLIAALGVSQPVFSRLTQRAQDWLLVTGRARSTRYAMRRPMEGVGSSAPIYEVDASGLTRKLATLHATLPEGFYVEAHEADISSGFHGDLPYFLNDLRPAGYLGRLVPAQHPELELPSDIQRWSAEHCLKYLTRYGWNLSGALIVGDEAFRRYLSNLRAPSNTVAEEAREARYPGLAADALKAGEPGSSAGGEQPKFLATLEPGPREVLVKFSPPVRDRTTERLADLLVAEHLALQTLRQQGMEAAESRILSSGERTFLESVRFDRLANGGRRGLLSLLALDAEFVGHLRSWSESAERLCQRGHLEPAMQTEVRRRELFSQLIANTDRHPGNLSFFTRGARVLAVAPAYDVSPSHYAPRQGHIDVPSVEPPVPSASDGPIWPPVYEAARAFWAVLSADERVSRSFRVLARSHDAKLKAWRRLAERLPTLPTAR